MSEINFKKVSFISLGGALIIAGGVVASSALLRSPSLNVKSTSTSRYTSEKTVSVKGVAEREVTSDLGVFEITINCSNKNIPEGYKEINRIYDIVLVRLKNLNIPLDCVEQPNVYYNAVYDSITTKLENNKTETKNIFKHYRFTRECRIVSKDVNTLAIAAQKLNDLISEGIEISVSQPQFFINNPEQYKLELVDSATESAFQRAKTVAEKSGSSLGPLLRGRQGVIQITKVASNETSDYGMYDTTSIKKLMRLVVTLEYSLK